MPYICEGIDNIKIKLVATRKEYDEELKNYNIIDGLGTMHVSLDALSNLHRKMARLSAYAAALEFALTEIGADVPVPVGDWIAKELGKV